MMGGRKQQYKTRDPETMTRDPEMVERDRQRITPEMMEQHRRNVSGNGVDVRKSRRYIPASMPVVCPDCGGPTRMADGRHVDPVRKTVLEYRTCARCGQKLAAGRAMVAHEEAQHCRGFEGAVAEYQNSVAGM